MVYTDGACKGNPGSGGWAYVCLFNGKPHMIVSGHKDDTTNNCMELTAICKALNYIKKYNGVYHFNIEYFFICSDSAYCINAINQNWIENWKRNGWKTNKNIEIKNKDIWEKVYNLLKEYCKMCKNFHCSFYVNEEYNCSRCNLKNCMKRIKEKVGVSKMYYNSIIKKE